VETIRYYEKIGLLAAPPGGAIAGAMGMGTGEGHGAQ
jgi:hypothetical protein